MTIVKGFAGRLANSSQNHNPAKGPQLDGLRRFPRRTMGIYRPELDPSWLWRLSKEYRK